jgi:hypothetical protein
MKGHGVWMIVACAVPLLLIFVLPALGVTGNVPILIGIAAMFGLHLVMMAGHRHKDDGDDEEESGHGHH